MSAKNKRAGSQFETDIVKYVRSRQLEADRLRLNGTEDEGDIAIRSASGKVAAIIEAKAGKNVRPRYWFDEEAVPEAKNYAQHRSMVVPPMPALAMKSHGRNISKALVTITLEHYIDLLGGKP